MKSLDNREQEIYKSLTPGQRHEIDDLAVLPAQVEMIKKGVLIGLSILVVLAFLF